MKKYLPLLIGLILTPLANADTVIGNFPDEHVVETYQNSTDDSQSSVPSINEEEQDTFIGIENMLNQAAQKTENSSLSEEGNLHSGNLIDVYNQTKQTNPTLKSADAQRQMAYEAVNSSRANLLPQLGLSASYARDDGFKDNTTDTKSRAFAATLTQTLFNYSLWKNMDIAERQASAQDITYHSQEQTLILNVATAYFNVLRALDTLQYTKAQKDAIYRQLDQTEQKHKVGLVAITDVETARANYDLTRAQLVAANNSLDNALETLREVSGVFYDSLAIVNTDKFKTENPGDVKDLLKLAENNNLQLISARLAVDLAKDQIRLGQSTYLPTVSLSASSKLTRATVTPDSSSDITSTTGDNVISITASLPIFTGGSSYYQVKQAQYNYISYSEQFEAAKRSIINSVRSSYNNIVAAKSSITAYEQSVSSALSSAKATEAGYQVGTQTIVDVLNSTTQFYSSLKSLSGARYDYLISILQLKSATGKLIESDLILLNNMLTDRTSNVKKVIDIEQE